MDTPARLNIFALPTRTTLLFALIVLIIFLPVVASLFWSTPICGAELFVVMLILPLRSFLRRPEQIAQAGRMQPLPSDLAPLQTATHELARTHAVGQTPQLLLQPGHGDPYTFGSWKRRVIALPLGQAQDLLADLQSHLPARVARTQAILLHELSHFRNRDVWMTWLAYSVLIVAIVFMTLSFLVYLQVPLIYNALVRAMSEISTSWPQVCDGLRPFMPGRVEVVCDSPQAITDVTAWVRYETFNLSAHVPFVVGGLILLLYFWRHILITREFYADARTAAWLNDGDIVLEAQEQGGFQRDLRPADDQENAMTHRPVHLPGFLSHLPLRFHPSTDERFACLDQPETVYGSSATIGVTAALAVLSLEAVLGSALFTSFMPEPGSPTMFVLGFVLLSLSLLPRLCAHGHRTDLYWGNLRSALLAYSGIMLATRFVLTALFSVVLLTGFISLDELIRLTSAILSSSVPIDATLPLPAWLYVWLPFAFNALLLLPLLGAALWLDARLKRAVLTWYAAPWLRQWFIPICWAITLVLAGLLWLVILPLLVIPLFGNLTDLWGPPGLWLMLTTLGAAVGGLWFMQANRRWQQRCSCGNRSTNPFQLGMSCPGCGQLLNAWLVATYKLTP